jgi:hypothetical protein
VLTNIDGGLSWAAPSGGTPITPGAVNTVYESDGGVAYFGPVPAAALAQGSNGQFLESDGGVAFFGPISGGDVTCSSATPGNCTVGSIFGTSPISISPSILQYTAATTSPEITQTSTSAGSGATLTIQAQGATGASNNGGNLRLASGTSGSATVGAMQLACGSTVVEQLTQASSDFLAMGAAPASVGAIRLSNNTSIYERNAANSADFGIIGVTGSNAVSVGDPGASLSLNGGGASGSLQLASSYVQVPTAFGVGGGVDGDFFTNKPFNFGTSTQTLGHGGTTSISTGNATAPYTIVTDTGLTSNATVAYPAASDVTGAVYYLDATGVTFSAHTISVTINSHTWGTTISAGGVWQLIYNGTQFYGIALTP